jgi:hypothetical protein
MSQLGRRVPVCAGSLAVTADPNSLLFTATIAQNAALNGRIQLPEAIAAGRACQCIIRDIQVVSLDANIWEFWFWANSLFASGDSRERFLGSYLFGGAGVQIAGAGNAHASASGLDLFYEDEDAMTATPPAAGVADPTWRATTNGQAGAFLNVTLINRSAGAKTAGGFFGVCFMLEPTLGHA